jgi:hypothetical protein
MAYGLPPSPPEIVYIWRPVLCSHSESATVGCGSADPSSIWPLSGHIFMFIGNQ